MITDARGLADGGIDNGRDDREDKIVDPRPESAEDDGGKRPHATIINK